jgi:hypothetical protein
MNPLLQKTQASILAKVNPRLVPVVKKLVNAGQQLMYSPQTRHLMQSQLQGHTDDPEAIGAGIAKLLGILYHESRKTAPVQALIPAGMLLLCDGLQFLEDAGMTPVTPEFLAHCTQATGSAILQLLGIKPEQVQQAMSQAQAAQGGAPAAMPPGGAPPTPAAMPAAPAPTGVIGGAMAGAPGMGS